MATWEAVQTGRRLRELEDRLKAAGQRGGKLQRELRRDIKHAGNPVVEHLGAAAMQVTWTRGNDPYARRARKKGEASRRPTSRKRSTGLRVRTASAIGIAVTRKGIRIRVSERRFGPYGKSMPRYMDGELRRYRWLRHPVHGDMDKWVEFHGKRWFFQTIRRDEVLFDKAVNRRMDRAMVEITR
jgi:hypothetical protein